MNDTDILEPANHFVAPGGAKSRRFPKVAAILATGAAVLTAGAGSVAGLAGPAAAAPHPASTMMLSIKSATVAKYGPILENGAGYALYYDSADKLGHWACTGKCLKYWPPVLLPKGQTKVEMGKGVTSVGTVKSPWGTLVTWDKRPLYTFAGDKPGTVKGQGIGKVWWVAQLNAVPSGVAY